MGRHSRRGIDYNRRMGVAARVLGVALMAWAVTPALASARVPKSAAPVPAAPEPPAPAEVAAEDAAEPADAAPDVDPAALVVREDAEASGTDDAHLHDEAAEAAPSEAALLVANPQVQTVVRLFGRGVIVNDDAEEPPSAPVSVRLRPAKRAGGTFQVSVRF